MILLVALRVNPPVAVPRAQLGGGSVLNNSIESANHTIAVLDNSVEFEAIPTLAVLDTVFFRNQ